MGVQSFSRRSFLKFEAAGALAAAGTALPLAGGQLAVPQRKGAFAEPTHELPLAEDCDVIVAENGVVYHTDPDCVYLKPHVHEVDASELGTLRANDGSIYHPCEYCHPSQHGTVFITPDGNRYHSSRDCSRLLRTTHEETAEEASKHLRPCPKCGGKH